MTNTPRYQIEHQIVSIHENDNDASFTVRRNGKLFYIEISPSQFINSPLTTTQYLTYLALLRSGEEVLGNVYDTDVYEWVMAPFKQLLVDLAPKPLGEIQLTLQQHLFPEFFVFNLAFTNEKPIPNRIFRTTSPCRPSFVRFDDAFLDELEEWTIFYDPANITLSPKKPEDALFKPPRTVLLKTGETCFFKPCQSSVETIRELKVYQAIEAAGLAGKLNVCRLYGVVMDDHDFILGLLLSHINCADRPLSARVHPDVPDDPPPAIRHRWMEQLESALGALHDRGIVWGDAKAENVLIDRDNIAWITDFGGGYTEGWVDKELAETVDGDLMGMAKMKRLLFPSSPGEGQEY